MNTSYSVFCFKHSLAQVSYGKTLLLVSSYRSLYLRDARRLLGLSNAYVRLFA